jgi:hypothetical protein
VGTGDITYIATEEGSLFLAVVIDLFSRKVVGWSMRPDTRLERDVVDMTSCGVLCRIRVFYSSPAAHPNFASINTSSTNCAVVRVSLDGECHGS